MKKIILYVTLLFCMSATVGCSDNANGVNEKTSSPYTSEKITSEPTATPEPTPKITEAPKATIEPGKETYTGSIIDDTNGVNYNIEAIDGNDGPVTDFSLAVQFFATTEFDSITKSFFSSDGTLVITLFKWLGSFNETVYSKNAQIAAREEYDNISSSGTTTRITLEFEPQPDGEYLIYITSRDLSETVTGWIRIGATTHHTNTYIADEYVEDAAMSYIIHYTKTPENMYGPVQA